MLFLLAFVGCVVDVDVGRDFVLVRPAVSGQGGKNENAFFPLACAHAQPKTNAAPIFRRTLASHERSLVGARGHSEAAGQITAREMEMVRIKGALPRVEKLSDDVAAAIERFL